MSYFNNMGRKKCFIHYKLCKSVSYRNIVDIMELFCWMSFSKMDLNQRWIIIAIEAKMSIYVLSGLYNDKMF